MLEFITVCVDYSDFLELCIGQNKRFCDNYIVVTAFRDNDTKTLCQKNGVNIIETDVFYKNGSVFNKGAAINEGFKKLKYHDWICIIDADTRLPDDFNVKFNYRNFNNQKIYGSGRRFIWVYQDWIDLQMGKKRVDDFSYIEGYGVGFFQGFSCQNEYLKKYIPDIYPHSFNCNEVDIDFLKRLNPSEILGIYKNLEKIDMDILCFGPHGIGHDGRLLARDNKFKLKFKDMPNLSKSFVYEFRN